MRRVFKIILVCLLLLTLLYGLVTISFDYWMFRHRDVIQIDFEGITFNSPPGWVESRRKDFLREKFGEICILPGFQVGFRHHDQITITHLKEAPELGKHLEFKTTAYWRYVDSLHPKPQPGHDNAATLIRFINLEDQWYGIGYHTYSAAFEMNKNKKNYGIPQQIMDSINSIRFVKRIVSIEAGNLKDTQNAGD